MFREVVEILQGWGALDTWIVVTAALAAMSCAVPGCFLLVRRQCLMGDALSHTALPGIVITFLAAVALERRGWISSSSFEAWKHTLLYLGALVAGVLAAVLVEWVQRRGRVEASAALGVVFTTLFALGLLLIRWQADAVHLDADCVLFGNLETGVMDTLPGTSIPWAAVTNGAVLLANLILVRLLYKELLVSAFDPRLATAMGIPSRAMHYGLVAVTAGTVVSAFESVGSILVIAMMIVPPATAYLFCDRLGRLLAWSLAIAAGTALAGHLLAITVPPLVFSRLGYPRVADANTAGMTAVAGGLLFTAAALFSPRYGLVSRLVDRGRLAVKIAGEDLLGLLYRREEQQAGGVSVSDMSRRLDALGSGWLTRRLAVWRLERAGAVEQGAAGYRLTDSGRDEARRLVRAHRLWESYLAQHFDLQDGLLHESAERVEHYLDSDLREHLETELDSPEHDPHGRIIPAESEAGDAPPTGQG